MCKILSVHIPSRICTGSIRDGGLRSHKCHLLAYLSVNHCYSQIEFTLIVSGNAYTQIDNWLFFQLIEPLSWGRLIFKYSLAR